jgi:hypothetical protein
MDRIWLQGVFVVIFIVVIIFLMRYLLLKVIFDPKPLAEAELETGLVSSEYCSCSSKSSKSYIRVLDKIYIDSIPICFYLEIFNEQHKTASKTIIIICHGNSGNILSRKFLIDMFRRYRISFCIFDYRGYGISYGKHMPSIDSMVLDAKELIEHIKTKYPDYNIVLWGESLGALVICQLFAKYPFFSDIKTVFFAPFLGVREILGRYSLSIINIIIFPWCYLLPFSILENMRKRNLLIVVSRDDKISNPKVINELFPESEILIISGSHSNPIIDRSVVDKIRNFIL